MRTTEYHGLLMTNAFLRTDKFLEHYRWLLDAAKKRYMQLDLFQGTDFFVSYELDDTFLFLKDYDFILYWDKDIPLGRRLSFYAKQRGILMLNGIEAIDQSDDKISTYERLFLWNQTVSEEKKIPCIPTIAAPMTYQNIGYTNLDFLPHIIEALGLPLVIKECRGSFGMQVYLAKTEEDVISLTKKLAGIPFLYQKYIKNSKGRDVRLQVVGDQVVAAMYRYSEKDFRANLSNGGKMRPYQPSGTEKELAINAAKALKLDFAGIDLLFSGEKEEADLLCEVNSNAHFKNIFVCTGVNVADSMMEYVYEKLREKS